MLLLSALWLAVVQALASLAVPATFWGTGDRPSRVVSVRMAATEAASASDHVRPDRAPATAPSRSLSGDEAFRPPAPQRLPAVDRTSGRGAPPLRLPVGIAAFESAELPVWLASAPPRAADHVSHAAAARGGHLPYYPTAPPRRR